MEHLDILNPLNPGRYRGPVVLSFRSKHFKELKFYVETLRHIAIPTSVMYMAETVYCVDTERYYKSSENFDLSGCDNINSTFFNMRGLMSHLGGAADLPSVVRGRILRSYTMNLKLSMSSAMSKDKTLEGLETQDELYLCQQQTEWFLENPDKDIHSTNNVNLCGQLLSLSRHRGCMEPDWREADNGY